MLISPHHINNVLRVYGDQLRQGMIPSRAEDTDTNTPERIGISARTRSQTIINDIVSNIIERITQLGPNDNFEKGASKKLETEHNKPMTINEDCLNQLIFKEINGNDETINSLSIEDSKFSTNKIAVKNEKK